MEQIIRGGGSRTTMVIGPLVMVIGAAAGVAGIVLALALDSAGFLALLIPAALGLVGGALVLRGARRARLRADGAGIIWAGVLGPESSLRWEEIHRVDPPPPGDARTAAVVTLRDGAVVPIRAVWEAPTSPAKLLGGGGGDLRPYQMLVTSHQRWLAGRR